MTKKYYLEHRDEILEKRKQFYKANRKRLLMEMKKTRDKAAKKKYDKIYYATHPEKFNTVQARYAFTKCRAMKRGLDFLLDFSSYEMLLKKPCFYCAEPLNYSGCGLDRIDNSKGYILENVIPCCGRCNTSRQDNFSVEEWKVMIRAYLDFRNKK